MFRLLLSSMMLSSSGAMRLCGLDTDGLGEEWIAVRDSKEGPLALPYCICIDSGLVHGYMSSRMARGFRICDVWWSNSSSEVGCMDNGGPEACCTCCGGFMSSS